MQVVLQKWKTDIFCLSCKYKYEYIYIYIMDCFLWGKEHNLVNKSTFTNLYDCTYNEKVGCYIRYSE